MKMEFNLAGFMTQEGRVNITLSYAGVVFEDLTTSFLAMPKPVKKKHRTIAEFIEEGLNKGYVKVQESPVLGYAIKSKVFPKLYYVVHERHIYVCTWEGCDPDGEVYRARGYRFDGRQMQKKWDFSVRENE